MPSELLPALPKLPIGKRCHRMRNLHSTSDLQVSKARKLPFKKPKKGSASQNHANRALAGRSPSQTCINMHNLHKVKVLIFA
jgi:hypothetical protein